MSTLLTEKRPKNYTTSSAIPNGDVGFTKTQNVRYVTIFVRNQEHDLFFKNGETWNFQRVISQGQFLTIKADDFDSFYVR